MNMDLEEMKAAWQVIDRRLDQQNTLLLNEVRTGRVRQAKRALRPLRWGQGVQIIAGMALMFLFAPYWVAHINSFHVMLPGLLLHGYGLAIVIAAFRSLYLLNRVDHSAPVVEIQSRLAELGHWRVQVEFPLFAAIGCFIWIPLLMVMFNVAGVDVWARTPQWVYWNIVAGFVCLGVLFLALRRMRRSPKANSFVGRSILNAQAELDEIANFERESS